MNRQAPEPDRAGSVGFGALLPHAPILVPAVGGARCREVKATIDAMREVAQAAVATRPVAMVVVSPHSPRRPRSFGLWGGRRLRGSLVRFRAPAAGIDLPVADGLAAAVRSQAGASGVTTWWIDDDEELDHGAVVPLWFLAEAGWSGPTLVMSLDYPGDQGCIAMGRALGEAVARAGGGSVAVIASGDMSHALRPEGPAGFHPSGALFDQAMIDRLRAGEAAGLDTIPERLRDEAAEDAWDSTRLAVAAADDRMGGHRVLSYEGPFGVGYGVAVLYAFGTACGDALDGLPGLARRSVEDALGVARHPAPAVVDGPLAEARAVFVTLHDAHGLLRGCIGALAPEYGSLADEVWHFARQAAFHDPRFPAVSAAELPGLRFEVSVLDPPQPVASSDELDPSRYGVVVRASGDRRGVLLPDLPGVGAVADQIEIARRKARIGDDEPFALERFTVRKFAET